MGTGSKGCSLIYELFWEEMGQGQSKGLVAGSAIPRGGWGLPDTLIYLVKLSRPQAHIRGFYPLAPFKTEFAVWEFYPNKHNSGVESNLVWVWRGKGGKERGF